MPYRPLIGDFFKQSRGQIVKNTKKSPLRRGFSYFYNDKTFLFYGPLSARR